MHLSLTALGLRARVLFSRSCVSGVFWQTVTNIVVYHSQGVVLLHNFADYLERGTRLLGVWVG